MRLRHLVLFIATISVGAFLSAQPAAEMAADIRTVPDTEHAPFWAGAQTFGELNGFFYFGTDDGVHGIELWRTDGTESGTELVKDICPGRCGGIALLAGGAVVNGVLFFGADDGVSGSELWITDGTSGGTRMVKDVNPAGDSEPRWLVPLGDRLVFSAMDPAHGRELWISDGTGPGTHLLGDLRPGPGDSKPSALLATGSTLFFNAFDDTAGREPWVSDGTAAGTRRLLDIRPGPDSSGREEPWRPLSPHDAELLGDRYFFSAEDDAHGVELWVTDGSSGGTQLVRDIHPGSGHSTPRYLTAWNDHVYFVGTADQVSFRLWRSDGSSMGTEELAFIPDNSYWPDAAGSYLYFGVDDASQGPEPWRTDGTPTGTVSLGDLRPGSEGSVHHYNFVDGGYPFPDGRFLFFPDDGLHGAEPWVSDGTPGGTEMLRDIHQGPWPSFLSIYTPFNLPRPFQSEMAFFAWNEGFGYEPWITDGTLGGTRLIRDIDDQASSLPVFFWFPITETGGAAGRFFFRVFDDSGQEMELWASGGTAPTTERVEAQVTGTTGTPLDSTPQMFLALPDTLVFRLDHEPYTTEMPPPEIWRSDGTPEGTFPLVATSDPQSPVVATGRAFYESDDGLWVTDGTVAGSRLVTGVTGGSGAAEYQGTVFLAAETAATGRELFKLDPDLTAASLVKDVDPGPDSSGPMQLTPAGGLLFFAATTPAAGKELWVTDGSESGTRLVADIRPGSEDSIDDTFHQSAGFIDLPDIVASGDLAFLPADDGSHGSELWVSDGSAAGTRLVSDLVPGSVGSEPRWLTDVDGVLYFSAYEATSGRELWRSDGTQAGTFRVADLVPGEGSSAPRFLVNADGVLYFAAHSADTGVELWVLAPEGVPRPAADVFPGPDSSSPSYLTVAGRRLFFFATDGVHGYEPWSIVLPSRWLQASMEAFANPDGTVSLVILLHNPSPVDQPDADGDEFSLELPEVLTGSFLTADSGRAELLSSPQRVVWNGALAAGDTTTLTLTLDADAATHGRVTLQGRIAFDTDGDGVNDFARPTDDPLQAGDEDPTVLPIVGSIPTLSTAILGLFALILLGLAVLRMRKEESTRLRY